MVENKIKENELFRIYEQKYEESRRSLDVFSNPTKKKLLMAAIDLFSQNGYTNVSMRDLAKAVGIKAASIYNHFPSKRDILMEVFNIEAKMQYFFVNWEFGDEYSAKEVLSCIFEYSIIFAPDELELFQKTTRILVMEQYREPKAYEAFTHYMLIESSVLYKKLFDRLIAQKKMRPFNTACYSKVLASVLYAFVVESSHYDYDVAKANDDHNISNSVPTLLAVKKYLYSLISENILPE